MTEPLAVWGIPVAILALAVAAFAAGVSLKTGAWQVARYLLDGGRVQVRLLSGIWSPGFSLFSGETGRWPLAKADHHLLLPEYFEVAQLVVENPGRIAVTITTPSLHFREPRRFAHLHRSPWRWYSVTPRMFDASTLDAAPHTTSTVRVDPYDRVTFLFDHWSVVPTRQASARRRRVELRGGVRVPGKRRAVLSPWRTRWRIPVDAWSARTDVGTISPVTLMFQALYRALMVPPGGFPDLKPENAGQALWIALDRFDAEPSLDDLTAALDEATKLYSPSGAGHGFLARQLLQALEPHRGHLSPWRSKHRTDGAEGSHVHSPADGSGL